MKAKLKYIIAITLATMLGRSAVAQQIDFKIHNENLDRHEVVIYPNPVTSGEMVKIKSSFTIKDIEITNIIGKCVQREKNSKQIYDDITLKLNKNAPGVYYAKITFEDDKWIIKKLLVR
ncbi:MAG: T9SS type A sorting domain-containing protein [Bacteroidales bacterium]|nr:T9SS type A sorting domain-containing protein [Bacteroidales bacterium]